MADESTQVAIEGIAKRYGASLAEECDLPEHEERFTGLFRDALRELSESRKPSWTDVEDEAWTDAKRERQ
jgi:hypothetical protein